MHARLLIALCASAALLLAASALAASRGLEITDSGGRKVGAFSGSYALLVGVSDYQAGWPKLESVPGELAKVEKALVANGFTVEKVLNPGGEALEQAFKRFIDRYGYDEGNRLLFYFSGHGYSLDDGNKGYLVPADAPDPRQDRKNFLRRSLDMSQILSWSRQMEARHALFLFDSCFSGTIFKTKALPDTPPHITAMTAEPVRQFLTAGSAGEEVPARSVFTPAFVDALAHGLADLDKDGYVSGTELGYFLKTKVPQHSRQTPQYGTIQDYNLSRGDFVFQVGGVASAPVALAPPGPDLDAQRRQVEEERRRVEAERERLAQDQAALEEQRRQESERRRIEAEQARLAREQAALEEQRRQESEQARLAAERRKLEEERRRLEAEREKPQPVQVAMADRIPPPPDVRKTWVDPVTGMEFVWVAGGCFQMGSPLSDSDRGADEGPVHEVCVDGFWMGKYEVTQEQWRKVTGDNPSGFQDDGRNPVERVSWKDVKKFIGDLNGKAGVTYRLPTEAEWEFACRSGGRQEKYSGGGDAEPVAWHSQNSGGRTRQVGTKDPNGLGLHDMSGNVYEWVEDVFSRDAYSEHVKQNPVQGGSGSNRVMRGGGWCREPEKSRCANRGDRKAEAREKYLGFRLARTP